VKGEVAGGPCDIGSAMCTKLCGRRVVRLDVWNAERVSDCIEENWHCDLTDPPSQLAFKRYLLLLPFSNRPLLNAFCNAWLADGRKLVCSGYRDAIHVNRDFGAEPSDSFRSVSASTSMSS
jgi:hypothetical protein